MSNSIRLDSVGALRADLPQRRLHCQCVQYQRAIDDGQQHLLPPGCLARSVAQRGHKIRPKVDDGRSSRLLSADSATFDDRDDGLYVSIQLPDDDTGDRVLQQVRSGVLDRVSVGVRPIRTRKIDGVAVHSEAALSSIVISSSQPGRPSSVSRAEAERRLRELEGRSVS